MDVYWLKVRWPDGSIYLDTVYFKDGDCEKRVFELGDMLHEEWTEA